MANNTYRTLLSQLFFNFKVSLIFEKICNKNVDKNTGSLFFVNNFSFVLKYLVEFLDSTCIMIWLALL